MWSVNQEIDNAISSLSIYSSDLVELDRESAREVINHIKGNFVEGNPSSWWMSLKKPVVTKVDVNDSDFGYIDEIIPQRCDTFYFVPENGETYRVFRANIDVIKKILAECIFFEYYIFPEDFSWLIIENDHSEAMLIHV